MSLARRIAKRLNFPLRPKPVSGRNWRPQWLPNWFDLRKENEVHPHDPIERVDQFLGYNTGSTEIKVLNWLYATILQLKPQNLVETGAADDLDTIRPRYGNVQFYVRKTRWWARWQNNLFLQDESLGHL